VLKEKTNQDLCIVGVCSVLLCSLLLRGLIGNALDCFGMLCAALDGFVLLKKGCFVLF
jgi:hypothetical protein